MDIVADFASWLAALDPVFAFLLALPFVVGALGLAALAFERRRESTPAARVDAARVPRTHARSSR